MVWLVRFLLHTMNCIDGIVFIGLYFVLHCTVGVARCGLYCVWCLLYCMYPVTFCIFFSCTALDGTSPSDGS